MSYVIGYQPRRGSPVSEADFDTASEAWQTAVGLQRGGESIKYIRTPQGEDISIGQLKAIVEGAGRG